MDKPGATPSVLEADAIENGVLDGRVEVFGVAHRSGRLSRLCFPAVAVSTGVGSAYDLDPVELTTSSRKWL